jgi:hypothetical protein
MTADDVAGAATFFADYRQALRDKSVSLANSKSDQAIQAQLIVDILNAMNVSDSNQSNVEISFDVVTFFQTLHRAGDRFADLKPEDQAKAAAFAGLAAKQVGVNQTLDVEDVKKRFLAGQFTMHPQDPPVKAGDGLGTIQPAQ